VSTPVSQFVPPYLSLQASLVAQTVKHLSAMQETQEMWVQSLRWDDTLEKKRVPTPVFLPEKPHGQSLVGYSSKCHRVRDN